MPFYYYDRSGYVALGPTIPQWRLLQDELSGDEGREFVQTGVSERPLALADEIGSSEDPQVAPLLQQLKAAAEKADTVLLLNDGTTMEAE